MKFDRNKTFPYPVLRPYCDDYVDVEFQTTVEFTLDQSTVAVGITYALSSDALLAEITNGNAKYISVVSCRETYFREVLSSPIGKISASFATGTLRGEVRVDPYLIVSKKITGFKSVDINKEFGDGAFTFNPGDVLAQDETQVFYIERDLFKPISSVFDLVKNEALSGGEWLVSFESDHVQIEVSTQMKNSIDNARNVKANQVILLNSLYFAAVVQALQRLKDGSEDYELSRWAQIIKRQLHNAGWDLSTTEPYILAQRLMKRPFSLLETYVFGEAEI
jgi:hypothetical protein